MAKARTGRGPEKDMNIDCDRMIEKERDRQENEIKREIGKKEIDCED